MLVLSLFEYAIELNKLNLIFFCFPWTVRKYPPFPVLSSLSLIQKDHRISIKGNLRGGKLCDCVLHHNTAPDNW